MADVGGISGERLKSFIERIERLEEEKAALAADIKDVMDHDPIIKDRLIAKVKSLGG